MSLPSRMSCRSAWVRPSPLQALGKRTAAALGGHLHDLDGHAVHPVRDDWPQHLAGVAAHMAAPSATSSQRDLAGPQLIWAPHMTTKSRPASLLNSHAARSASTCHTGRPKLMWQPGRGWYPQCLSRGRLALLKGYGVSIVASARASL